MLACNIWVLSYNRKSLCHDESKSHKKSCEYIIIYHDELYIALTTLEEINHIVKDKHKMKINPHVYEGSNFPYAPEGTLIYSRCRFRCTVLSMTFVQCSP